MCNSEALTLKATPVEKGEKTEMKRKKCTSWSMAASFMAAGLLLSSLSGCQSSALTEEEIVVPKEAQGQAAEGNVSSSSEDANTAKELAEQLQAPDIYQAQFNNDTVFVNVDAPVIIPETAGFKIKKVTARPFSQNDYDAVNQGLLKGAPLWNRDMTVMEGSHGFTKAELEAKIKKLEDQKAAQGGDGSLEYEGMGITLDERLEETYKLLEAAPDEPVIVEVPAIVSYMENAEDPESNWLSGYVTMEGQDYTVDLSNLLTDDFRWTSFQIAKCEDAGNYSYLSDTVPEVRNLNTPLTEIQQKAAALMEQLGFDEYASQGGEYCAAHKASDGDIAKISKIGYCIHFTRVVDGIPVTYTRQNGGSMVNSTEIAWPYEHFDLIYNDEGFACLDWINPYEIEDISDDYVFLLPFSEIQRVFEEMVLQKYEGIFQDANEKTDISISEVRLGYMRIRENGYAKEGTLIPVWDFFGSRTTSGNSFAEPYVQSDPYESLFTINAMDGTVIDREFGY